jgi:Protein of unknown function (DUF3455)
MKRQVLLCLTATLLAACSSFPAGQQTPVPANLSAAPSERFAFALGARGVQIYECRVTDGKAAWAFVAPQAELFDANGRKVGTHYAGPTWEMADGSRIVGTVKARADAPASAQAIPWLLLDARSTGTAGRFASTTSIQRVNTVGGVAPATGCTAADAGRREQVPYTADYSYFAPAVSLAPVKSGSSY